MSVRFGWNPKTGPVGGKALPLEIHGRACSVNPRKLPEPGKISAACAKGKHGDSWCTSLACSCPCHTAMANDGVLVDGLALLGLYSIWRALNHSRFDMPEGSGCRAAEGLKAQLGMR
jgi:hypothetical protein